MNTIQATSVNDRHGPGIGHRDVQSSASPGHIHGIGAQSAPGKVIRVAFAGK